MPKITPNLLNTLPASYTRSANTKDSSAQQGPASLVPDAPSLPNSPLVNRQEALQAVQASLTQSMNDFKKSLQKPAGPSVGPASPAGGSMGNMAGGIQKMMLKERIKILQQMMSMAGRDKASLKALAMQVAQLAKELKELAKDSSGGGGGMIDVTVPGVNVSAGASADGEAAAAGGEALSEADVDTGGGETLDNEAASAAADTAVAADSAPPTTDAGSADAAIAAASVAGQAGAETGGTEDKAAEGSKEAQGAQESQSLAGADKGKSADPDIEEMLKQLKSIQSWIKEQARQLEREKSGNDLKDTLDDTDKDLQDTEKILEGGSDSAQLDIQVGGGEVAVNVDTQA